MTYEELVIWIDEEGTIHSKELADAEATEAFFDTWEEMPLLRVWNATKYGQWYTNSKFEGELKHPYEEECLFALGVSNVPPEVRALALLLL